MNWSLISLFIFALIPITKGKVEVEKLDVTNTTKFQFNFELFPKKLINTHVVEHHLNPILAVINSNQEQQIVIGWVADKQDGDLGGVFGRIVDKNNSFVTDEFQVNTLWEDGQHHATLTSFNHGSNFAFSWTHLFEDYAYIHGQQYNSEIFERKGTEYLVHNVTTMESQTWNNIASFPDGGFLVIWQSWNGPDFPNRLYYVAGRLFDSNGNFDGDDLIFTNSEHKDGEPDVAIFSNGDILVTYRRELPTLLTQEIYRKYNRDGTPKSEEVIFAQEISPRTTAGCATFGDDTFVVVSSAYFSSKKNYFYNSRDELFRIIEMDKYSAVPTFATSPNGKVLIHVDSEMIYLFDSNGDLIGYLDDYTEDEVGRAAAQDVVFLDDETLYISWDLERSDPENSDARDIFGRFIKLSQIN